METSMKNFALLALVALALAAACANASAVQPQTGSIGVHNNQAMNWLINVDGSGAGTVAANSSTVIDNVKPGVHTVGGSTPPGYLVPQQWVTVSAGQTTWVNF